MKREGRPPRNAIRDQDSLERRKPQKIPILQTVTFGIGAGLWLVCHMINGIVSFCSTDISYADMIAEIDVTLYLLSIAIQVVFLVHYDGAILPNTSLFHYSIALMIADKVWVWLTVTLGNIGNISIHLKENRLPIYPVSNFSGNISVLHNSSAIASYTVFDITSTFLQPFFIEFLTISIGVLAHLWNLIGKKHDIRNLQDSHENADNWSQNEGNKDDVCVINSERERLLARNEAGGESPNMEENHRNGVHLKIKKLITGMFVIFIIILAACYLFSQLTWGAGGALHKLVKHLSFRTQNYLSRAIAMGVFFPVTVMSMVSLFKSYRNNSYWSAGFSSSDYLLFFATIATFIVFILEFIAATTILSVKVKQYRLDQAIFVSVWAVACIMQAWVQTQLILASQGVCLQGRSISKLTKICLIYTIAVNVAVWLQMAMSRESVTYDVYFYPVLKACFGEVTTRTLIFLLYPAMELYRFHSAVMSYQILKQ